PGAPERAVVGAAREAGRDRAPREERPDAGTDQAARDHRGERLLRVVLRRIAEAVLGARPVVPQVQDLGPSEPLPGAPRPAPGDGACLALPERAGAREGPRGEQPGGRAEQQTRA